MHHLFGWLAYLGIGVQDQSRFHFVTDHIHTFGMWTMVVAGVFAVVVALLRLVLPVCLFMQVAPAITFIVLVLGAIMYGATWREK